MEKSIFDGLAEIVGRDNISNDPVILEEYSKDFSPTAPKKPICIVWPKGAKEIQRIIEFAKEKNLPLVPVSSGPPRFRGDTIPEKNGSVVVDLSKMKRILSIDRKNRVAMIEPGVTFSDLIPELEKHGLRLLMPLLPRPSKSVLASCLEREPITIPRYHWDSSDPLLCLEIVFGTGDIFRTGAAAGPGTLEQQKAVGQSQKNPMGPTQFDPFRIIQGSQGTMGVVTWATIKCEVLPSKKKLFFVPSDELDELIEFTYKLLRRRLGDELFILNDLNFAVILRKRREDIESLREVLPQWILTLCISGFGELPEERIEYLEGDITDIALESGVELKSSLAGISSLEVLDLLSKPSEEPYWKLRFGNGCYEIFFLSTLDRTPEFIKITMEMATREKFPSSNIGVYLQPMVQGCSCHCEFDLYYDSSSPVERKKADDLFLKLGKELINKGGFFSRPYGPLADITFSKCSPEVVMAMKKVKMIFDPANVMNPGKLCFKVME